MEQFKLFMEKAKTDGELLKKLDGMDINTTDSSEVVSLAAKYGFKVTTEELEQLKKLKMCHGKCEACGHLDEEELTDIAGGTGGTDDPYSTDGWPTQNRYNPAVCRSLKDIGDNCLGWFMNCDHYSSKHLLWRSSINELRERKCAQGCYRVEYTVMHRKN